MIQVFLQNAWSPLYAGGEWPRNSWLKALHKSRSGKRLALLCDGLDVEFHNTTPIVGDSPDSVVPPDLTHIQKLLQAEPDIVVACGKQAEISLVPLWCGPLVIVPHPAHRLLTDKLYKKARRLLSSRTNLRIALRQTKGRVRTCLIS